MSAVDRITKVIASDVLAKRLTIVPSHGATESEVREEEALLGRRLCNDHAALLRKWNGVSLDVIRFFGCGESATVGRLANQQVTTCGIEGAIVVASDPAGFVYLQSRDAGIFCFDHDGGALERLATSLDDLVERVIFGPSAASFAGDDWLAELTAAGIVS